jgi:hypothetical protein
MTRLPLEDFLAGIAVDKHQLAFFEVHDDVLVLACLFS